MFPFLFLPSALPMYLPLALYQIHSLWVFNCYMCIHAAKYIHTNC